MIEKVNANLDDDVIRQVWALLLQRYARVACSDVSPWWNDQSGPLMELLVAIDEDAAWNDGKVARLLSVSEEYLDLLDETPTGELYYPYQALTLVEDCCNGILEETGRIGLDRSWEQAQRFAGHVDWQMRRSRIYIEPGATFVGREEGLWLAHSRLSRHGDREYELLRKRSLQLAEDYLDGLRTALSPNASADYVVLMEAADIPAVAARLGAPGLESGIWRGPESGGVPVGEVRWSVVGRPVYFGASSPANSGRFTAVGYLYLWSPSAADVASLVEAVVPRSAVVDVRAGDGMLVERDGFIETQPGSGDGWD